MGWRIKTFNIMGIHWKIRFLGEGFLKNQYIEKISWNEGGQGGLNRFKKELPEKKGVFRASW